MKIFIYIFLLFNTIAYAQVNNEIIRVVGDSLIGRVENGISYREVIGNVVMTQGDVRVTCNRTIQNITENSAELIGDVIVTQDTILIVSEKGYYFGNEKFIYSDTTVILEDGHVVLTADSGYYYFDLKKAVFNSEVQLVDSVSILNSDKLTYFNDIQKAIAVGNVDISDDASTIYCDSLVHLRGNNITNAFQNVRIVNLNQKLTIYGDELFDEGKKKYTRIVGNPLLIKVDSTENGSEDTLFIRAEMLEAIEDSTKKLIASDSVKIIRGDLFSVNNYSILFRDENKLTTYRRDNDKESPVLWYTNSQLVGDSINIYMKNNRIDSIEIRDNSHILSKNENYEFRFDQISGENINLYFGKNGLERTEVATDVLSIYYLYEDETPNGVMKSSSNRAKMEFENNAVVEVSMYESVESEYHPENLVEGNELDFTLPSFIIYKNKPKKEELTQRSK
ncbi:MAG: LPS export ABC transporter periplasmic protein LptC [Melioribacteraceae bacterium]|nr:LPS export ABC transporter periplasmic protein LptC [Melioribacteraceae bacterium]